MMGYKKINFFKYVLIFLLMIFNFNSIFAYNPYLYPVKTIFIDPGHGGQDAGAIRSYDFVDHSIKEKDINLVLANKVTALLKSNLSDVKVIQTRFNDTYLSLQERSQVCYLEPLPPKTSCIYVSLHVNAAENISAKGFEVFTKLPPSKKKLILFNKNTPIENIPFFVSETNDDLNKDLYTKSVQIANNIINSISLSFPYSVNRGVKSDNLYVLNVSKNPAVLVEIGFISNKEEAKKLLNNNYLDNMAFAIYKGIVDSL